jgi:hypothetical protein
VGPFFYSHGDSAPSQPLPFAPGFTNLESWSEVAGIPSVPRLDRTMAPQCHFRTRAVAISSVFRVLESDIFFEFPPQRGIGCARSCTSCTDAPSCD